MKKLLLSLLVAVGLASGATADCKPANGWPAGKQCQPADNVGIRVNTTDKSVQQAYDQGDLNNVAAAAGAQPPMVTFGALPTCNATTNVGLRRRVSDALDDSCTAAGGITQCDLLCTATVGWARHDASAGGGPHALGGATHTPDSFANLDAKVNTDFPFAGSATQGGTATAASKVDDGVHPAIAPISTTICNSGAFHDFDRAGDFDFATDRCVTPDEIFYADDYNSGSSVTCGSQEAVIAAGKGTGTNDIGALVRGPKGTCNLGATVVIGSNTVLADSQWGITFLGYGSGVLTDPRSKNLAGTTFKWTAGFSGDMIQVSGMGHHLGDFVLDGNQVAANGIVQLGNNGTGNVTGKNVYQRIAIFDVLDTLAGTQGWGISIGVSNLGQNDHTVFDQVRVVNSRHCLRQLDTQAVENDLRMFECTGFTASPGIMLSRGGLSMDSAFLGPAPSNSDAVGIQVDSCATVFRWTEGSIEWGADNGTVYRESDTGLGCGYGNTYAREIDHVRFQMQVTATTEHTCIEKSTRSALTLSNNTWTTGGTTPGGPGDALRKCDLEFDNPDTALSVPITMVGNRSAWNNGADLTEISMTVTSSGGGRIAVLRDEGGKRTTVTPAGVKVLPLGYDAVVDLDNAAVFLGDEVRQYNGNPCRAIQEAFNPSLDSFIPSFSTSRRSVAVSGTGSVAWSDYYDAGPGRYCYGVIPTSTAAGTVGGFSVSNTDKSGWPILTTRYAEQSAQTATGGSSNTIVDTDGGGDLAGYTNWEVLVTAGACSGQNRHVSTANATTLTVDTNWTACTPDATSVFDVWLGPRLGTGHLHVDWGSSLLKVDLTGQDENGVLFWQGNSWAHGESPSGGGFVNEFYSDEGHLQVIYSNGVASTGWNAGMMPEASGSTIVTPDRSMITIFRNGWLRNQMGAKVEVSCNGSNDDIGLLAMQSWITQQNAEYIMNFCGVGYKFSDNNVGSWTSATGEGNQYGMVIGEVPKGGDRWYWSSCLTQYCADGYTGGGAIPEIEYLLLEGNPFGELVSAEGTGTFPYLYTERGQVLNHGVILGAVKCDTGNATTKGRYVAESLDCGVGGAQILHATAPINDYEFVSGHGPVSEVDPWAAVILGNNASTAKNTIKFDSGFYIGYRKIPANSTTCVGTSNPWYCQGASSSDEFVLQGPSFPRGTSSVAVRVVMNSIAMEGEHGNLGDLALWPYHYYWFPNAQRVEWSCSNCDLNATDALGRSGGYAPDGESSGNVATYANQILFGYDFHGATTFTNSFLNRMTCVPGPWSDAGETESITVRPFLYNPATATSYPVGNSITLTEGVDTVGVPKSENLGINTEYFLDGGGTMRAFRPWNLGVYVSGETDATDNNLTNIRCAVEWSPLGND